MTRVPSRCVVLVTSRRRLSPDSRTTREALLVLERWLDQAIEAAVDLIQVREPDVEAGPLTRLVAGVMRRAEGTRVSVVVNDRADVAWAAGATGVHLPSHGLPSSRVRALRPEWVIGRSVHAGDPPDDGAVDYLVFGTVFSSVSKPGHEPDGVDALKRAVQASARPVVAIGGITPERAQACAAAGAAGVAAIGLFLPLGAGPDAMGVGPAVRALRAALERGSALPGFSATC